MSQANDQTPQTTSVGHKVLTVIGTVLCIILLPMLLINITLIVRSYTNPDQVPSIGGHLPLIVLTDSMYPAIQSGDLILCKTAQPETIAVGDVIAGLIEGALTLATKAMEALTGLGDLLAQMIETVLGFFGGFIDFMSAMFPFLPEETFTILNLGLILMIAAAVFRKFLN